jgi:hypothetical protein
MGMYDESWCASCGAGMHYTADESAECGKCMLEQTQDVTTRSSKFMEYMKIHLISLNQDWESAKNNEPLNEDEYDPSDDYFRGAIEATEHLLSVATDIMNSTNERVYE